MSQRQIVGICEPRTERVGVIGHHSPWGGGKSLPRACWCFVAWCRWGSVLSPWPTDQRHGGAG